METLLEARGKTITGRRFGTQRVFGAICAFPIRPVRGSTDAPHGASREPIDAGFCRQSSTAAITAVLPLRS